MLKEPYTLRQTGTTNAGTAVNVLAPPIAAETCAEIYFLALMNRSGESVTVEFGITDLVGFRQVYAKQTVADNDGAGVYVDFFLAEGDKLTAQVTGTANKSTVTFIASGEFYGTPSSLSPPMPAS